MTEALLRASMPAWTPLPVLTVGRHTARADESVHPLVAAALAARPTGERGRHSADRVQEQAPAAPVSTAEDQPARSGDIGWPARPRPGGGGVGWPGDMPAAAAVTPAAAATPAEARPRGWRRWFGRVAA